MPRKEELKDDLVIVNTYLGMSRNRQEKLALAKLRYVLKRACKEK